MGNVCVKSQTADLDTPQRQPPHSSQQNSKETAEASLQNNNDQTQEEHNHCKDGQCAAYVKLALDKKVITADEVAEYSEFLCDTPGEELTFNFDHITPRNDPSDQIDSSAKAEVMAALESETGAPPHKRLSAVSSTSLEDLNVAEESMKWSAKRNHNFSYKVPDDHFTTPIEVEMDVSNTKKRLIYAISDLHLGGSWAMGMEDKLGAYLDDLIGKSRDQLAALVLLGDIFEMWLEKFHQVPPTNASRLELWRDAGKVLISAVKRLVEECGVKVFYVRGNHDREITEADVMDLFDQRVTFIPCTLILHLQVSPDHTQRVRFAHGHEWDVFNSYTLAQTDALLPDKPIGYYIARAVATSGGRDEGSELEGILIGLAKSLLTVIPRYLEDDLVDVLEGPDYQRKLTERLFEGAFKVKDIDILAKAKCRVTEDTYIRLQTMLEYPLFKLLGALVGKQDVFHMIKASTGNYKRFIKRADEDVIVLAHTHIWDLRHYKNHRGNTVLYANTGCWTKHSEEFSAVILDPPSDEQEGSVGIDYGKNQ